MVVALVLFSAFLHAAWNALLKREPDKDRALIAAVTVATVIAISVAAGRWAITGVPAFTSPESVAWSLLAGGLELLYFLALARALTFGSLGPVYTISRGGAVLLAYPLSIAIYGERLTTASAAGSAVVFAGLVLSGLRTSAATPEPASSRAALAWAVACATAIAGYHLAYKSAIDTGGNPSAVFGVSLTLATAINYLRAGSAGRRLVFGLLRRRLPRVALMGGLCGGSFLILLEALSGGGAGFVLTLRNTSVLFATALAWAIGERPSRPQILGATLVAAGAVLMVAS